MSDNYQRYKKRIKKYARAWYKRHPERRDEINRKSYLKRNYGITLEEYALLLAHHNGCCWICRRPSKTRRLAVDHNHKTKQVRGLLCWKCNRGIAMFKEDPNILSNAVAYISQYDEEWHGLAYKDITGTKYAADTGEKSSDA